MKLKTLLDLERQAKNELKEEAIVEKKELIKERIREIHEAKRAVSLLIENYKKLLNRRIEDME